VLKVAPQKVREDILLHAEELGVPMDCNDIKRPTLYHFFKGKKPKEDELMTR
jgi:hypothetical protein